MEHNEEMEGPNEQLANQKEIGNRLRLLREKDGLTQYNVAEQLDISGSFYGLVERGERMTSLPKLVRLCEYYSVTMDYLILGKEDGGGKPADDTNGSEDDFIGKMTQYACRLTPRERRFFLNLITEIMKMRK